MHRHADSRLIISVLVSILAVIVLALTAGLAWRAYGENAAAKRATYLNALTDKIILMTGVAAVERGLTAATIGATTAEDAVTRQRIDEARRNVDSSWREIEAACRSPLAGLSAHADFSYMLEQTRAHYLRLRQARDRVDGNLRQGPRDISRVEWIDAISRFIESTADMREIMAASTGISRETVQLNVGLKQRVWLISEYAGLERGILAYYIGGKKPIPDEVRSDLKFYRSIVEYNLHGVAGLSGLPETDPRITHAIGEMEQNFLSRFNQLRSDIYVAARRGDYRLSAAEWFDKATKAIDSIHVVLRAASRVIEERTKQAELRSLQGLVFFVALFGASLVLTAFVLVRVIRVANALFHQKELAEVTLHSIGDAVITTDALARVEYLNPIAEEMTGWSTAQATGKPLQEVFGIVNGVTREPQPNPIERCLEEQRIISLENNTVLIRRDGQEFIIEDSAAPVRDRDGKIVGAVMVFYDATQARNMPHLLSYQATHDALTGLINRREFERRLLGMLESARSQGQHHAMCYLDLDQFKVINDTCGHAAGDRLLRQLTPLLKARMREQDALARLGGDEFGVLLEMCPIEKAASLAEDLCRIAREFHFEWQGKAFEIGISIGVVPITPESVSLADIMSEADAACYAAKDKGRGRVQVYQPNDAELLRRHGEMQWVTRLNQALEENRFRLYHQTILPLTADNSSHPCCEVLLRLLDENGEIVPPTAFIPSAERYTLMPAIDGWVVRNTLAQFGTSRCGRPAKQCHGYAINLSGASLGDEHFLDFIYEQFEMYRIPPEAICFEITETAVIANLDQAMEFMLALRRKGCRFALDDFGSGMSSFLYLKNLPVDYLKITGTFVRNLADTTDCAMVDAIHRIGQVMGIKTIAEFVENEEILEKLRELGVNFAQGYGISHPKPLLEEA